MRIDNKQIYGGEMSIGGPASEVDMSTRITKNRQIIIDLLIIMLLTTGSTLATVTPISDIPVQTVQGQRYSPPYQWKYAFDIGFSDLELSIEMRIGLGGANPGASLEQVWENGIESMWSHRYNIVDSDFSYHVNFDVIFFFDPYASVHHDVTVIAGVGRGDMLHWYTTSEWGEPYNGAYVAHEVGHMFSLYDEYPGGAQDPLNPIVDYSSIMGSLAADIKERHYNPFLNWLQTMAPDHELAIGPYGPKIPEPATAALLAVGTLITFTKRKNRKINCKKAIK
jgi:hypothetical protein